MPEVMSSTIDDLVIFFEEGAKRPNGISIDQELSQAFADALGEIRETMQTAEAFLVSRAVLAEMPAQPDEAEGDNVVPFRPRQRPAFCDGRGGGGAA